MDGTNNPKKIETTKYIFIYTLLIKSYLCFKQLTEGRTEEEDYGDDDNNETTVLVLLLHDDDDDDDGRKGKERDVTVVSRCLSISPSRSSIPPSLPVYRRRRRNYET